MIDSILTLARAAGFKGAIKFSAFEIPATVFAFPTLSTHVHVQPLIVHLDVRGQFFTRAMVDCTIKDTARTGAGRLRGTNTVVNGMKKRIIAYRNAAMSLGP